MKVFESNYAILSNKTDGWPTVMVIGMRPPYVIAKPLVLQGKKQQSEIDRLEQQRAAGDAIGKVEGYSVFLLPCKTLRRGEVERAELRQILNEMADYFYKEKMEPYGQHYYESEEGWHRKERGI